MPGILRLEGRARLGGVVLGLAGVVGCSVIVNTSDLSNGASGTLQSGSEAGAEASVGGGDGSSLGSSSSSGGVDAAGSSSGSGSSSGGPSSSSSGSGSGSSSGSSSSGSGSGSSSGSSSSSGSGSGSGSGSSSGSSGGADAGVCASGTKRCSGNGVEVCNGSGQWGSAAACQNQTCVSGVCTGVCAPGQVECKSLTPQTCDGSGQWAAGTACTVACCSGACVNTTSDTSNCGGCGTACGAGYRCGAGFTAFTSSQPSDWTANGSAVYDAADHAGQLTDLNNSEAGSWVYDRAILADPITVQFDFFMSGGGADGMGLIFATDGATALGHPAQGLGMAGLTGFGVEFDDYNNNTCLDSNANHIGIDSLDLCPGGIEPNTLAVNNSPGITVDDGNWHTVVVVVKSGAFTVTADGNAVFAGQAVAGWPSNPTYYLGFTGGTGGFNEFHRVRNVSVIFPKARCY